MRRIYAVWLGSALLAITALFHLSGFLAIPASPPITDASTFYEAVLRPLWLFASMHWLLIASVCVFVAKSPLVAARIVLPCCGCVVLVDEAVLYWFIGSFIGVWLLAAAGVAMMVAAFGNTSPTKANPERN